MRLTLTLVGLVAALALLGASPALAGSCSATQQCSGGGSVSCTGSSTCSVGSDFVECDGTRTYCQVTTNPCDVSYRCPTPPYSQPWGLYCTDRTGQCSSDPFNHSITCGSTTYTCDACENSPPFACLTYADE